MLDQYNFHYVLFSNFLNQITAGNKVSPSLPILFIAIEEGFLIFVSNKSPSVKIKNLKKSVPCYIHVFARKCIHYCVDSAKILASLEQQITGEESRIQQNNV